MPVELADLPLGEFTKNASVASLGSGNSITAHGRFLIRTG